MTEKRASLLLSSSSPAKKKHESTTLSFKLFSLIATKEHTRELIEQKFPPTTPPFFLEDNPTSLPHRNIPDTNIVYELKKGKKEREGTRNYFSSNETWYFFSLSSSSRPTRCVHAPTRPSTRLITISRACLWTSGAILPCDRTDSLRCSISRSAVFPCQPRRISARWRRVSFLFEYEKGGRDGSRRHFFSSRTLLD